MTCPKHLQSGHSAFFKKKSTANKCRKKIIKKEPNQTKLILKKTNHTLNGKGWLIESK